MTTTRSPSLKPFWCYYGGKWRAAPRYPKPQHARIVEPFAGAAGYSMRYPDLEVVLVERYAVLAEMWRYLIAVPSSEIRRIPLVEAVADLPAWVPQGGRSLIGFRMNAGCTAPRTVLSSGRKKRREMGRSYEGWSENQRERVASQVERIRHWKIIEGDYRDAPGDSATWFIDPPYNHVAGSYYVHAEIDYAALGTWCRERQGQVIVCENEGATWLPFEPFATIMGLSGHNVAKEVVWTRGGVEGSLP